MATFNVDSTFAKPSRIHTATHAAALERYIADCEDAGFSYPSEAMIRVRGNGETRDYVCVDGFFDRDL